MVRNIKLWSHKLSGTERKNLTTSKVINIVTPKACAFINLVLQVQTPTGLRQISWLFQASPSS